MFQQIFQYCAGFCGVLGIVRYCAGLTKLCGPAPAHPVRRPDRGMDVALKDMFEASHGERPK